MTPSDGAGAWRRLHPYSLIFSVGASARRLLIPGLAVLFFAGGSRADVVLMALFVPSVLAAVLHYASFRFLLGQEELIVKGGVVFRYERHIPYYRIQNIDQAQNPIHRLLGVAEVTIETATGKEPEAQMRVLSRATVDEVRRRVFEERRSGAAAPPDGEAGRAPADGAAAVEAPRILVRLGAVDLVKYGLISNRGMAIVVAAWGLAWELEIDVVDRVGDLLRERLSTVFRFETGHLLAGLVVGLGSLIALILSLRVLSIVWAFVNLFGFTLSRVGDDLRTRCGLLTRVSASIPRRRIQATGIRESVLHRAFATVAVRVETAGADIDQHSRVGRQWLVPILPRRRLVEVLDEVEPGIDIEGFRWDPVHPRAQLRLLRRGFILAALPAAVAWLAVGIAGLATLVLLLPLVALNARRQFEHMGWAMSDRAIAYRRGWWTRRVTVVRFPKIQAVSLHESPFDRRHGMASILVDTAGASTDETRLRIPFLERAAAGRLVAHLEVVAAHSEFRW